MLPAALKVLCVCGHIRVSHNCYIDFCEQFLGQSGIFEEQYCKCQKFKLDNLSYIEQLAKEKNLI